MENLKGQIHTAVNVFKSGDLKKAEKLCHNLISTNPKVVFLYNLMGLIMNGQKKVTEAIKYYEKGIKVDPNFGIIYNNLGLIYYELENKNDGIVMIGDSDILSKICEGVFFKVENQGICMLGIKK